MLTRAGWRGDRGGGNSNSQFVHCDLVQGIEIAIAIGIGVDFIIDPGDFDPDFDPDPDEPSHIENCWGGNLLPLHERARRVNKAGMHTSLFEALMLACFSVSWFFSIARSLRSRSTGGKSIWFLWIIFTGYCAGCVHKVLNNRDWVLFLYVFNNTMVFTDILLYFRNRLFERRTCAAAGANAGG